MVFIGIDEITEEEDNTMADEYRMALLELLRKAEMEGDADFLREGVRVMGQALMELEVSLHIGAERHERTAECQQRFEIQQKQRFEIHQVGRRSSLNQAVSLAFAMVVTPTRVGQ